MAAGRNSFLLLSLEDMQHNLSKGDNANIDDTIMLKFARQASAKIESRANRKFRHRSHTEFYRNDGANYIQLRQKPVSEIVSFKFDRLRVFGSDTEVDTDLYDLDIRLGRILLKGHHHRGIHNHDGFCDNNSGGVWRMASANPGTPPDGIDSSIEDVYEVVYKAGFNHFEIEEDVNDTVEWQDSEGDKSAIVTAGNYLADDLATEMQTKMNAAFVAATDPFTVTYNQQTAKFKFKSTDTIFVLKFFNGTDPDSTIGDILGFDVAISQSSISALNWGEYRHKNGTATTTATVITPESQTGIVIIKNTDLNKPVQFSFDEGANWIGLPPDFQPDPFFVKTNEIQVRTLVSGDTAAYTLSYTVQNTGLGGLTQESDHTVLGIPDDLNNAAIDLATLYYLRSSHGNLKSLGNKSIALAGPGGTHTFDKDEEKNILKGISNYSKVLT